VATSRRSADSVTAAPFSALASVRENDGTTDASTTVERAVALLWELYDAPDGLSASELARRLETQRTALYRLLRPFLRSQFIRRDERKRYFLGFGITALARAVAQPIEAITQRPLQGLADATGCAAMIIADTDGTLVTVASATPREPGMYVASPNGFVHQGNDVAIRALRAGQDASPIEEVEALEDRERGFASNERDGFVTTVAMPLRVPLIGAPSCLLIASLSPLDLHSVAEPMRQAIQAIAHPVDR